MLMLALRTQLSFSKYIEHVLENFTEVFIGTLSTPNSRFRPVFVEMNVEIFYIKRLNMTIIKSDTLEERKILTRFHFKGL